MLKASPRQRRDPRAPDLVHFRKSATIYSEGEPAPTWFVVEQGVVRTCRFYANGHRQLTGFRYAGDVFGYEDSIHVDCAEAVTDLVVRRYRKQPEGLEKQPETSAAASGALRNLLDNAYGAIALFGRRTAPERLAAFMLMTLDRLGKSHDVELPMCRTDIADYLGLTIHTVSRTLTQMSRERLIAIEGAHRCRIVDMPGLRALAGMDDE